MRDPFSFGGDAGTEDFYGDIDARHQEARFALKLKVVEVGRNVCFGGGKGGGGGGAPAPDPNIGVAALKQAEIGQGWLNFAEEQFREGNIRQEALDALTKRVTEQQIQAQDMSSGWAQQDRARYEGKFRPLEDMAVMDAYGASNMSDDQLRSFLGKQNEAARSQIQNEYNAKVASIRALASQKETLSKVVNGTSGGMSPENAQRMAQAIITAEMGGAPQEYTRVNSNDGYGSYYDYYNPDYEAQNAEYQAKVAEVARSLQGGGATTHQVQELVRKYSDQDINSLIEAETANYKAKLGQIGANEEAIFAQRQAERLGQDNRAAEAKADVASSSAQQRQASQRSMASMGINPTSGRYQGVDRAMETATALASAGAQTNARRSVTAENRAARSDAINIGAGLPSSVISNYGLGLNAGNSATANAGAAEGNWRSNVGIMGQGYGGAMQGYAGMGNTLQSQYNSQLNAWGQQQQANAASSAGLMGGLGSLAGGVASVGTSYFL